DPGYATQIILTGRLTRLYERQDWAARLKSAKDQEPMLLERGVTILLTNALPQPVPVPAPPVTEKFKDHFDHIYQKSQAMTAEQRAQAGDDLLAVVAPNHKVFNASIRDLRQKGVAR
ncbi:MAG: hypothetical protein K8I82_27990, partial [Anaerolineae bacterium]|nr:hypothetical protein [Anaerolineae bacterium]